MNQKNDDNETPIFDRSILLENVDNNEKLADEVLNIFFEEETKTLLSLKRNTENSDADGINFSAHKMKGASLAVGAITLSEIAYLIEKDAAEGELERCKENLSKLEKQFELLKQAVR